MSDNEPVVLLGGETLLFTKENALRSSLRCPGCKDGTLIIDSEKSAFENKIEAALLLQSLGAYSPKKYLFFHCTFCKGTWDVDELHLEYDRLVKPVEDLRGVARACNPEKGQTWAASQGLPVELCPINGNPCFTELWRVCPHIGNDQITDAMNDTTVPIVGEIE